MNKIKYLIFAIVAALLLFGVSGVYAETTTTTTTSTATTTAGPKTPEEQGKDDGKAAGEADGAVAGAEDRYNGLKSNYRSRLLKDSEITGRFRLDLDSATYRVHFVSAYRQGFKDGYERAFRDTNLSIVQSDEGSAAGESLGMAAGALAAMDDYIRNLDNNANRAYTRYINEKSLSDRFHLSKDNKDYARIFSGGFEKGFKEAYTSAYRTRVVEFEVENANTYEISGAGEVVSRTWPVYDVSAGGVASRPNLECTVDIQPGTLYAPTYINVSGEQYTFNYKNYLYTPVSSVFNVKLWSNGTSVILRKPIVMRFNVVGSEKAGIYQWNGYKWNYLPTVVSDEGISTVIPAGHYSGGRYAIFIDEKAKPFSDTAFSWARDEINAFKRRGYIDWGDNFQPDAEITRGEIAKILFKMLYIKHGMGGLSYNALDRASFGDAATAIDFVLSHGFMTLSGGKFNAGAKFKYDYAQYLCWNVNGFIVQWKDVADKIMQERFYRSAGLANKNKNMTRAEAVYFLYHYFDK